MRGRPGIDLPQFAAERSEYWLVFARSWATHNNASRSYSREKSDAVNGDRKISQRRDCALHSASVCCRKSCSKSAAESGP